MEGGRIFRRLDLDLSLVANRASRNGEARHFKDFAKTLHRKSKRAVGEGCILVSCLSRKTGAATTEVRFFEFSKAWPRSTPGFPDPVSH
ncbi:unnamed protein product [Sphagnum jensenii]|uniref:Uncharacterized protein n=1 Tax=Sphagnum jensenii TaxID=128206 RepID=A0ABP0WDK7_9BRYO